MREARPIPDPRHRTFAATARTVHTVKPGTIPTQIVNAPNPGATPAALVHAPNLGVGPARTVRAPKPSEAPVTTTAAQIASEHALPLIVKLGKTADWRVLTSTGQGRKW